MNNTSRFVDEVYGGGGGGEQQAPPPLAAAAVAPREFSPISQEQSSSSPVPSILRKGVVWCVIAGLLGVALAVAIIALRFKSIDKNSAGLELAEQNEQKQKTVLIGIGAGLSFSAATLLVTRIALKWRF